MSIEKTFILAEAGVNHNGELRLAKKMIDVAKEAGADAVKFQTFKAERVISRFAPKAEYQKVATGKGETQLQMVKRFELDALAHKELLRYCQKRHIGFISSPFDVESIHFLKKLGLNVFKIPSGEITNLPYLRSVGVLGKRLLLSTGMSDMKEIATAVKILVKAGTAKNKITVLQCNTAYPTPFEDANLSAMLTIRDVLEVAVGYSDHTLGMETAIAAVAMGASVIEKHFTLNRRMKGPDHSASLEPDELKAMVRAIRNVKLAMGDGVKRPTRSEKKNIDVARKSIVADGNIKTGEIFTQKNITVKRPGTGISPMKWDVVIGRSAKKDFKQDELIKI